MLLYWVQYKRRVVGHHPPQLYLVVHSSPSQGQGKPLHGPQRVHPAICCRRDDDKAEADEAARQRLQSPPLCSQCKLGKINLRWRHHTRQPATPPTTPDLQRQWPSQPRVRPATHSRPRALAAPYKLHPQARPPQRLPQEPVRGDWPGFSEVEL